MQSPLPWNNGQPNEFRFVRLTKIYDVDSRDVFEKLKEGCREFLPPKSIQTFSEYIQILPKTSR